MCIILTLTEYIVADELDFENQAALLVIYK